MQPFSVRDAVVTLLRVDDGADAAHLPAGECPACAAGYPRPCPRVIAAGLHPVAFDAAGTATEWVWRRTTCAGAVHAEGAPVLEVRCAACGMPP